jgi:hypothetical protein
VHATGATRSHTHKSEQMRNACLRMSCLSSSVMISEKPSAFEKTCMHTVVSVTMLAPNLTARQLMRQHSVKTQVTYI